MELLCQGRPRDVAAAGDIKVLESANPMFEKAAVDALKQWRYTPGPYDVILTVRVNFTLK